MLWKGKTLPKFSPFVGDRAWIWNQVGVTLSATCCARAGITLLQLLLPLTFSVFQQLSCFVFKPILYLQLSELSWQTFSKLHLGSGQLLVSFKKLLRDHVRSTCIITLKCQLPCPFCSSVTRNGLSFECTLRGFIQIYATPPSPRKKTLPE